MTPITFSLDQVVRASPAEIANKLLDLSSWSTFHGFGVIPGTADAEIITRTDDTVGTKIRLTSSDGSSCIGTVAEWKPDSRVTLRMTDFVGPLFGLATSIEEKLELEPHEDGQTTVVRFFKIVPTSDEAMRALHEVALDLKRAMLLHLGETAK